MMTQGVLYLLPNLLDPEADIQANLPANIHDVIAKLDGVICETEKPTRRFLSHFKRASTPLTVLNEHTKDTELEELLNPLFEGKTLGIISDAGLACIADPGSRLVALAHQKEIQVIALVGPCSIIMALSLSGFSGQKFTFHGYLPRQSDERKVQIRALEQKSKKEASTEIFIEAPYRNQELLKDLVEVLQPTTKLAAMTDLTGKMEQVRVLRVKEWRINSIPDINKRPTVFLISA